MSYQKHWAIEILNWEPKSGLGLGEQQVSGDKNRSEKSVGIAVLAYLFVLRVCHQVEYKVKVKMGKTRKAA